MPPRPLLLIALAVLFAAGCQRPHPALTAANYRHRFDRVEAASRERPGALVLADVEADLGPGEPVAAGHPDLAGPPGMIDPAMAWSRWEYLDETLLVGFADGRMSSVVRLRR